MMIMIELEVIVFFTNLYSWGGPNGLYLFRRPSILKIDSAKDEPFLESKICHEFGNSFLWSLPTEVAIQPANK